MRSSTSDSLTKSDTTTPATTSQGPPSSTTAIQPISTKSVALNRPYSSGRVTSSIITGERESNRAKRLREMRGLLRPGDDPDYDNEVQSVDTIWSTYRQGIIGIAGLEGHIQEQVNALVVSQQMKISEATGKSVLISELAYQKTMLTEEELDEFDQLMMELQEEKNERGGPKKRNKRTNN